MAIHELSASWFRRGLFAMVVVALVARGAVIVPTLGRLEDPDNYLPLARALAEGRGFVINGRPTAYRPPLYPIVLAPLTLAAGRAPRPGRGRLASGAGGGDGRADGLDRAAVGALEGEGAGRGGDRGVRPGPGGPGARGDDRDVIGLPARGDPGRVDGPGSSAGRRSGGLGFGLASLCRPSVLPALALVAGAAFVTGPGGWRRRARMAVVMVAAAVATLAPWAWRNARALGEPVWTTTHGGYTLALANNPVYYAEVLDGPPGAVWSGPNQRRWWEG